MANTTDDGVAVGTVADFSRRHGLELLRFAYLIAGDRHRGEDLVQDVLLALHRRFGDVLTLEHPVAYARRAIVNANVSWARRAMNSELSVDAVPETAAPPGGSDPAERDVLWQALKQLPERQRSVLVMRYYLDATDRDIADALDCRPGTVRSLASRGLDSLRHDATLNLDGDPS